MAEERLYADLAATLSGLHAREHTAQVSGDDRIRREAEFREGTLPVLYCSPTMELGIDIVTYCATGNAHDQYYFRYRD